MGGGGSATLAGPRGKRGPRHKQREGTRASKKGKETREKRGPPRGGDAARPAVSEAQ